MKVMMDSPDNGVNGGPGPGWSHRGPSFGPRWYNPAFSPAYSIKANPYTAVTHVENKKGEELKRSNRSRSTLLVVALAVLIGIAACPSNLIAQAGGTFTVTGNLTTARTLHTATLLKNGKVLIAGGNNANGVRLVSAELYDPSTRTFTATGNMITPKMGHLAIPLNDGRVLIVGGYNPDDAIADPELYDPSSGTFLPAGRMTTLRQGFSATLLKDGNVLIAGGLEYDASSDSIDGLASAELYDPVTATFAAVGNMTTGRGQHTATLLHDGRVLVAGGVGQNSNLASAEIYDPSTRAFTASGSMTSARAGYRATLLQDGTVLIVGPGGGSALSMSGPPR